MSDCSHRYGYENNSSIRSDNKIFTLVIKPEKYTPLSSSDDGSDYNRPKQTKYQVVGNSKGKEKGSSNQDDDAGCCTSMT